MLCVASAVTADRYGAGHTSIDIFPDEVLLHIFYFYRVDTVDLVNKTWGWHRLVHVCQRWRRIILASQHSLDLRLVCTERTPVRKTIYVWPPFPIIIEYRHAPSSQVQPPFPEDCGDLVAALGHHNRVYRITLRGVTDSLLGMMASALEEPFPALTELRLESLGDAAPALPADFLGGSAARLERVWLESIKFPAFPRFLLSGSNLVELRLDKIPGTWYIPPETMAGCLSALSKLVSLSIEFQSPHLRPDHTSQGPPTATRIVLPALAVFFFKGVSEYLDDLVARIDAPHLTYTFIKFFNQLIFDISQLPQFLARTEKLRSLDRAEVFFDGQAAGIGFYLPETTVPRNLTLRILCSQPDWQLSSLAQVCNQSLPLLSRVERLDIRECPSREPHLQDKMQWVDLLHQFTAVKSLHIPKELGPRIAPVLRELTEPRAAEVLPALNSLIFEELDPFGSLQDAIQRFLAARERAGHSVDVRRWDCKWERDMEWEWDLAREWERNF